MADGWTWSPASLGNCGNGVGLEGLDATARVGRTNPQFLKVLELFEMDVLYVGCTVE
jgi:hypothetical protein